MLAFVPVFSRAVSFFSRFAFTTVGTVEAFDSKLRKSAISLGRFEHAIAYKAQRPMPSHHGARRANLSRCLFSGGRSRLASAVLGRSRRRAVFSCRKRRARWLFSRTAFHHVLSPGASAASFAVVYGNALLPSLYLSTRLFAFCVFLVSCLLFELCPL